MLWSTDELAKAHIARLHAEAERARLIRSATVEAARIEARARRIAWWRRLMGQPVPSLGSPPIPAAT
jgi:hypothetical protein